MPKLDYLNFDLLIENAAKKYRARVIDSPAGQAATEFARPFSELELENFYLKVGRPRQGVRRLESPEMDAAQQFGKRLFDTVFSGEVYACFRSSLNEAATQNKGLRMRLRVDTQDLSNLPWEFIYSAGLNRFLAWSIETPLVRYIEMPQPVEILKVAPPIKVLVMISSPSDFQSLDVDQEWNRLKDALQPLISSGQVQLERVEMATLSALQQRLRRSEYHIFHFIGHGGFDERAQDGVLVFEDENGRGRPLSGQYLGTLLHDHKSLRLAVLNACEGARTSQTDPFAGVAQCLVQQGIPAVIAMQFEITDQAAITFAQEFYTAVVDGFPVDAAVGEARKAIVASGNDIEWGTPVLFTRAPDGHIFDIAATRTKLRKSAPVVRRPSLPDTGRRIARVVITGLFAILIISLVLSVVFNTIAIENTRQMLTAVAQTATYGAETAAAHQRETAIMAGTEAAFTTFQAAKTQTAQAGFVAQTTTRIAQTATAKELQTATAVAFQKSLTPTPSRTLTPTLTSTPTLTATVTVLVKQDLIVARKDLAGVQANGYMYAIGGASEKARLNAVEFTKINSDGSITPWQITSFMKYSRNAPAAVSANGYLYVIGGGDGSGEALNTVERAALKADGSLGPWEDLSSILESRYGHAAVVSNGYIYVIAGSNNKNQPLASVERAALQPNGTLGKWELTTPLQTARSAPAAVTFNNFIYVVGGWDGIKWAATESVQINAGGGLASWKSSALLLTPRESAAAVVANGQVILAGGSAGGGAFISSIEAATINSDGSLANWRKIASLKTARAGLAAVIYNQSLYAFGGESPSPTVLGSVERIPLP
jgi:N-acetylneuraminic acid mutarotase